MKETEIRSCVYRIINTIDGKYYIGSTDITFNRRKNLHLSRLRRNKHHSPYLQNAFNKYGEDAFVFEILHIVPDGDTRIVEQLYLDIACCQYNIGTNALSGFRPKLTAIECCNILLDVYQAGSIEKVIKNHKTSRTAVYSLIDTDSYRHYGMHHLRRLAKEALSRNRLKDSDIGKIRWLSGRITTGEIMLYFKVDRHIIAKAYKSDIEQIPCPDIISVIQKSRGHKKRIKQTNKDTAETFIWRGVSKAARENNISVSALHRMLRNPTKEYNRSTYGDSHWEYIE